MPSVDTLSNKGILNVLLDRAFSGVAMRPVSKAALSRLTREDVALFMNLTRLVDKALREYDASRDSLTRYVNPPDDQLRTSGYIVALDHMENCISATHRAVVNTETLRQRGYGRSAPRLTTAQQERLAFLRNAIEHSDERILGTMKSRKIKQFTPDEPVALRLANRHAVIGGESIRYTELVDHMKKLHAAIEVLRGAPTGDPGPNFPNMQLRTDYGARPKGSGGTVMASDYLRELNRLIVTH